MESDTTIARIEDGSIIVGVTGTISNYEALKKQCMDKGACFNSDWPAELVLRLLLESSTRHPLAERVIIVCNRLRGGYSMMVFAQDMLVAVRDPTGSQPLARGYTIEGETVFAPNRHQLEL